MSSRKSARAPANDQPIPPDVVEKILEPYLNQAENRLCADCGAKGPRWASTNLGIYICIRCSGIHRSLGTHITKVKSTSMDKWLPEQLEFIKNMGNARAKAIYEANVPPNYPRPHESDPHNMVEAWIRAKYERKEFMSRDGSSGGSSRASSGGYREEHRSNGNRDRDHRDRREREREREAPKPTPTRQQPVASTIDAFGWDEPVSAPAPTPAPVAQPRPAAAPAPVPQAAPAKAQVSTVDIFAESLFATEPPKPTATKESIMSLYSSNPLQQAHVPRMGVANPYGLSGQVAYAQPPVYQVAQVPYGYPQQGQALPPQYVAAGAPGMAYRPVAYPVTGAAIPMAGAGYGYPQALPGQQLYR